MAKVLVVDDEKSVLNIVSKIVSKLGHVVLQASDGEEAWDILHDNKDVALVLTDIMMPKVTGLELSGLIRDDENLKDIPIILFSGIVGLDKIEEILESGHVYFIPKPLSMLELQKLVKQAI